MPLVSFDSLPDDSRLWIFGAERCLAPFEQTELLSEVDRFLADWRAHGTPLAAARDLNGDRFLMVAVDQASVPPSGCSIDAMVAVLKDVEVRLGVALVDHGALYYRGSGRRHPPRRPPHIQEAGGGGRRRRGYSGLRHHCDVLG